MDRPTMHCHGELERDLGYADFLPQATLFRWSQEGYSTSAHLLTLYGIARGLAAKQILEIGFGRSTFVLAKAAGENGGRLTSVDTRDFSYLFSPGERSVTQFVHGASDQVWDHLPQGVDMAFLDYFSSESMSESFLCGQIERCLSVMKTHGVIAVHDVGHADYRIGQVLSSMSSSSKRNWWGLARRSYPIRYTTLPYGYGLGLIEYLGPSPYGSLKDPFVKKPETA